MFTANDNDVVITGIEGISAAGNTFESLSDAIMSHRAPNGSANFRLNGFNAAPLLTDRRMLKAVSRRDSFGLATLENLKKKDDLAAYQTYRKGMYVGAPPSSTDDHESYLAAVIGSKGADEKYHEADFGELCMSSRPTTLLLGLPNNVLCYGSIIFDVRGPNNNYTSAENSAHLALQAAARNLRMGRIDCALAGGYTEHTDAVRHRMHRAMGWLANENDTTISDRGTILADGAVFASLERRQAAYGHGRKVLATYLGGSIASPGQGLVDRTAQSATYTDAIEHCMLDAIQRSGMIPSQVGMIFLTGSGFLEIDRAEEDAVARWSQQSGPVTAVTIGHVTGNLMEAGGLLELGILPLLQAQGQIPVHLRVKSSDSETRLLTPERPIALIVRSSIWGDVSCIAVSTEL